MKHEANSMEMTTYKLEDVWYVASGASKHMTSHKECFSFLEKPETTLLTQSCMSEKSL